MTIAHQTYIGTGFGLILVSDLPVPGMMPLPASAAAKADIVITIGQVPVPSGGAQSGPYTLQDDMLLFDAPGVARYWAQGTRCLTVAPAPGASMDDVSALLIATALPMLLWRRGGVLLHATCVTMPGRAKALAIAGVSGSGKSALAAKLIAAGARLIADDATWLANDAGVTGLSAGTFQWTGSGNDRVFVPLGPHQQRPTATLGAILVLGPNLPPTGAPPQRLSTLATLEMLLRHRHRPRIPALLGLERDRLAQCVLHSRAIPTYAVAPKDDENPGSHQHIIDFISDRL